MSMSGTPVALELRQVDFAAPATTEAPKLARQWAAKELAGWDTTIDQDVVLLLLSEVVTNAVIHGVGVGADRDPEIRVELIETVNGLHLKVHDPDHGDAGAVKVRRASDASESGRGLELVEALSAAWWCEETSDGKCVHVILGTGSMAEDRPGAL